jgi:hypothetical protein
MALAQLKAAQASANAAWAAVAVYWAGFAATVISLAVSSLIALVAVRGPERERHTRDLETRMRRTRLYSRAALAGLRGLAIARRLQTYIGKQSPSNQLTLEDLKNFQRRLDVRRRVIEHFTAMDIRDTSLVDHLTEVGVLLESLRDGIDIGVFTAGGDATRGAQDLFAHRKSRLSNLRTELQNTAASLRAIDSGLQDDLDQVWKLAWLFRLWERPETVRD